MQGELISTLRVTQHATSGVLKALGMIKKQGNSVSYKLKQRAPILQMSNNAFHAHTKGFFA